MTWFQLKTIIRHLFGKHTYAFAKGYNHYESENYYFGRCMCGASRNCTPAETAKLIDEAEIQKLIEAGIDNETQAFGWTNGDWRVAYADGKYSALMPKHIAWNYSQIFKSKGIFKSRGRGKNRVILTKREKSS